MKLAVDLTPTGATMLGATLPPADTAATDSKKPAEGIPKIVEQKASPLKVLTKELRTLTPAESESKEVEFSEYSYQTMVDTITHNLKIVDQLVTTSSPNITDMHRTFYETMKLLYKFKKEDLGRPEKLKEYAEKFLQEHKGPAVRMAKELAEWESATLQAATGREIVKRSGRGAEKSTRVKDETSEVSFIQTQDGSVVSTRPSPQGLLERAQWGKGQKVITQIDRIVKGGKNMDLSVGNGLLSSAQREYLAKCGWTTKALNSQELLNIDTKLSSVAAFRQEMYVKTGQKDLSKIEVNYIKKTPIAPLSSIFVTSYIDNKTAYFINETTTASTDIIDILRVEGRKVALEVKTKVEKEFAERDKKKEEEVIAANTVKKLKDKIEEIKKSANLSEAKKKAKVDEIEAEIKRLTQQSQDFTRTHTLRGEIEQAEKDRNEAEQKLREWVTKLPGGITFDDLKNWSDPTQPEYIEEIKQNIADEKEALGGAREELKTLEDSRSKIFKDIPNLIQEIPIYDNTGKAVGSIPKANATDPQVADALTELGTIRTRKAILEGIIGDSGAGLVKTIKDLEKKYSKVQRTVQANADIKALCEKFHKSDSDITRLKGVGITGEIDEVSARVAKLLGVVGASAANKDEVKEVINGSVSARSIEIKTAMDAKEAEIEKSLIDKEEAKKSPDALSAEKKAQIDGMEALIKLYEPSGKEAYEKTFATLESGETVKTSYDPEWDKVFPHDTTQAIKRIIHLFYGDGVMMKYSDQEVLYKQVMTLFKSKAILDIVIDDLEASPLANVANPVAVKPAAPGSDGLYTDAQIAAMFPAGTRLSTIDANNIDFNRDLALKILNHIRETIYNVQKI